MQRIGINLFLTLISIVTTQVISAQDEQSHSLIRINHISKIEAYLFHSPEKETNNDSVLISKEYFNERGYRTKIEIYDSTGLANSYEYVYKNDSIRLVRLTYFKSVLRSKTDRK